MEVDQITEVTELLDELEAIVPRLSDETKVEGILYRRVSDETQISDTFEDVDEFDGEWEAIDFRNFTAGKEVPIAAVDCGIVRIGETENGLVIALRSAIVKHEANRYSAKLFRSGPIYLRNQDKAKIMRLLGEQLGSERFYVDISDDGKVVRVKTGYADDAHQFGDRFRNWFERKTQMIATSDIHNGILLLDGALTLRTRDTPAGYIERLAEAAVECGNALVGVSKQSKLQVFGRPFQFLLDPYPVKPCYCCLSEVLRRESEEGGVRARRTLGNMYACRFSPLGGTFRVDVFPVPGQTDGEVLNSLRTSAAMRAGYPDILVQAHTLSYFTAADVVQLQASCGAKYPFVPRPQQDMTAAFAPFGGRFK